MAKKDPFKVPPILEEDLEPQPKQAASAPSAAPEQKAEITKGGAPKNLFKKAQNWGMAIVLGAVLIYCMIPDNGPQNRRSKESAPLVVDPTKQASDTNNLMNSLKEQAQKSAPAANHDAAAPSSASQVDGNGHPTASYPGGVAPVVQGNPAPTPLPSQYQGGQPGQKGGTWMPQPQTDFDSMAAKAKREEEIRAAPLEVQGTIKLRTAANSQDAPTTGKLTDLQEQLAAVEAKRRDATQAQSQLAAQAMAGMNQQPAPVKRRSANEEFLANQGEEQYKTLQLQAPASQIMLQENTIIRSVLLSEINSDLPGKVSAMVTSDVYDSIYRRYVVIPRGSTLIGVYSSSIVIGQEAVLVAMTRLILPNGNWISLGGAPASNLMGRSGLDADVNNHFLKMFSTSFVLGATSLLLPKDQSTVSTTSNAGGTVTTGSAAGLALSDALTNVMQRNKSIAPTLTTKKGIEFMFMVAQDMAMVPYKP